MVLLYGPSRRFVTCTVVTHVKQRVMQSGAKAKLGVYSFITGSHDFFEHQYHDLDARPPLMYQ
jgi:hypothetical protein